MPSTTHCAMSLREPDLRLERPAIGAEVDELRRIVLSERRRHGEADADDGLLAVRRKLLWRHRRRPVEVHRHPESRIAQSEPVDLRGFARGTDPRRDRRRPAATTPALADRPARLNARVNENAVVLIVALASSMGAAGSNARSPQLKLLTTVTMFSLWGSASRRRARAPAPRRAQAAAGTRLRRRHRATGRRQPLHVITLRGPRHSRLVVHRSSLSRISSTIANRSITGTRRVRATFRQASRDSRN